MGHSLDDFQKIFFIGIAGTGMSALAQYLAGSGKEVSGSDRYFEKGEATLIRKQLEQEGIRCFNQDGSGITDEIDLVVVSTAIEKTVPEVQKSMELKLPILKRSEVLAMITASRKTIAVAGTSGKSTTAGMIFSILQESGNDPGIISGAGLVSIIKEGKIGNAHVGSREGWLVIEADESDGSVVLYEPEGGLLLNIDKDHQEIQELVELFTRFKHNCRWLFITNRGNDYARALSADQQHDFSTDPQHPAAFMPEGYVQDGFNIRFSVQGVAFSIPVAGKHNLENAMGAVAFAVQAGVSLEDCSRGLAAYQGIYRRHQVIGKKRGITVVDDYAHNPVKCAAGIEACQAVAPRVIAWFQPHGYTPTKFLKNDFIAAISNQLRAQDEIWMSEIYYAGGTAEKTISAKELTDGISANGKQAFFLANRNELASKLRERAKEGDIILLMGARDPGLEKFAADFFDQL